jgi:uncharacterized protein (TIGR04255 family)
VASPVSFDARQSRAPSSSSALPRFAKPPVVEVAISVQFEELPRLELVDFGLFWERLRARYPTVESHDPIPPMIERFDRGQVRTTAFHVEEGLPLRRCWYLSEDGTRLVQLQPDRFVLNWRKAGDDGTYPTYDRLRADFERELTGFLAFARERDLGRFEPNQCELTYVNHFHEGREGNDVGSLPNILTAWRGESEATFLPKIEDTRLAWQYRFDDERGQPLGRLHVMLNSAVRTADDRRILALQLVGRGAPQGDGVDGVLVFADRAHEWIVRGFTDVTTERMHELWEREA